MKRLSHYISYVLIITTFISCTSVIQVTVPNGKQELVVDAFLDNSSNPQTVRLTFNANYFSGTSTPAVLGATVTLTDLTNTKTYSFTPDGNGNYIYTPIFNDSMAQVHHKYQLNISYDGNKYIALSTLKRTAVIDSILFRNSPRDAKGTDAPGDTSNPRKFYPYVFAKDSTGPIPDYYWLKIYKNGVFYNQPGQLNSFQDAGYPGTDGYFFLPPVAFQGLTSSDNRIYRNDVCTAEVYSIDSDTYGFLSQMQTQLTNSQSGLFAVTPQNVKTNIQQIGGTLSALGWFNIGAISSKSIVAK